MTLALTSPPILRFAPSPNGRLHLGHAYSAWLNSYLAEKHKGRFLVRIEDIDTARCTAELTAQCLDDLAWLGLSWETPVRCQSQHFDDYKKALHTLKDIDLVYPCFCTRAQIADASFITTPDNAPFYPGTCKTMTAGEIEDKIQEGMEHSWRLDLNKALAHAAEPLLIPQTDINLQAVTPRKADLTRWDDVILCRKDTPTSYHLSVVVDDALQHITHVVRGADLEASTDIHVLLQRLLGCPTPAYYHHRLISFSDGRKFSKSDRSVTLSELENSGQNAKHILDIIKSEFALEKSRS